MHPEIKVVNAHFSKPMNAEWGLYIELRGPAYAPRLYSTPQYTEKV
jgi:hypothetical protein